VFLQRVEPSTQAMEDVDTARLVMRIQGGDDSSFAELYMRYFDRVYSYLRVLLRNAHDAEEATQQVFLQVLEALPAYERRRQPFRAWLFTVVRNHAIAILRKRDRTDLLEPDDVDTLRERPEETIGGSAFDWISDRELVMFVERLPLPQRQVLVLRFFIGLSATETAAVLGRSPTDVRTLQYRALRYLEDRLAAVGRRVPERTEHTEHSRSRAPIRFAPVLRTRRFMLAP
jgi:RNA polymerase sigma-70 factor (ECF subfamily)